MVGLKKGLSNRGRPRSPRTKGLNRWRVGMRPSYAKGNTLGLVA